MSDEYALTAKEINLLSQYLEFYESLAAGKRHPTTDAQRHFVDVCNNRKVAQTEHEIAFMKYRIEQARQRRAEVVSDRILEYSDEQRSYSWIANSKPGDMSPYRNSTGRRSGPLSGT